MPYSRSLFNFQPKLGTGLLKEFVMIWVKMPNTIADPRRHTDAVLQMLDDLAVVDMNMVVLRHDVDNRDAALSCSNGGCTAQLKSYGKVIHTS